MRVMLKHGGEPLPVDVFLVEQTCGEHQSVAKARARREFLDEPMAIEPDVRIRRLHEQPAYQSVSSVRREGRVDQVEE